MEILFIILAVAAFAAFAWYQYHAAQKRRQELAALAARYGWMFQAAKDWSLDERFADFRCLRQGSNRYAYNMLHGQFEGRAICGFDYHYETYSTDSKGNRQTHHHYFSAIVLDTQLPLKPLVIRPEGFFDKISEFFGLDDIDFESNQFSNQFHVTSPDRRWAFDVLHQETMEFLLGAPRFKIEMAGPCVITYRSNRFEPVDFEQALAVSAGIIDRLPGYLLREWKGAVR